jgi:hypothetical protein
VDPREISTDKDLSVSLHGNCENPAIGSGQPEGKTRIRNSLGIYADDSPARNSPKLGETSSHHHFPIRLQR